MLFNQNQPTTLIVVYKDEMFANQLKKLVETNDDSDDGVVGVKDGSVDIVAWDEKTWSAQKKAGNITSKVLFLGDVKGTEKLIPVIDEKFNKYGIRFGWAGKQAIIYSDDTLYKNKDLYAAFTDELNSMAIPESFKYIPKDEKSEKIDEDSVNSSDKEEDTDAYAEEENASKGLKAFLKAKKVIAAKLDEAGDNIKKFGSEVAEKAEDLKERSFIKKQQMLYGVINFYYDGMNSFINS